MLKFEHFWDGTPEMYPEIPLFKFLSTPTPTPLNLIGLIWTHVRPTVKYRVAQKIWHHFFLYALTLPNINRLSKLFHGQNQEKICNDTVAKDPTTLQVCRYTTLWNVSVIKATIENKTTSATTHFKKLITGNNVFIVWIIVKSNCHILHQMFNVSALLLDDALKPATPLTNGAINENQLIFDKVKAYKNYAKFFWATLL